MTLLLATLGHSLVAARRQAHRAVRDRKGGDILNAAVVGTLSPQEAATRLSRVRERDLTRLFVDLGRLVSGTSRDRLRQVAQSIGFTLRLEARCRSRDWATRLHAVRLLQVLGGGAATVPSLLDDRHPEVRRAAIRWVSVHGDAENLERVLTVADRPPRPDPVAIVDAVTHAGRRHLEPVLRYLWTSGPNVTAVLCGARSLADERMLDPALRLSDHPSGRVRQEVARLLGAIASQSARQTLDLMVQDADPAVREAALQALSRIGDWRSAPAIARGLNDEDPRVRHTAARTLRRLGSPGILLLQEAARSGIEQVRRNAQHVLDMPDTLDFGGMS